MTTLSYGYLLPQNPDTGDAFFPAMDFNIQRLNDHNHDGSNSARIALTSQSILSSNWSAAPIGGGIYRQLVTMPVGLTYDDTQIWFRFDSGESVSPLTERASANTYYVYTNDDTQDYVAFYR